MLVAAEITHICITTKTFFKSRSKLILIKLIGLLRVVEKIAASMDLSPQNTRQCSRTRYQAVNNQVIEV